MWSASVGERALSADLFFVRDRFCEERDGGRRSEAVGTFFAWFAENAGKFRKGIDAGVVGIGI